MKKMKLLTVLMLTISYGFLSAQTNQGKVLIGVTSALGGSSSDLMNLGYSTVKYKSDADGSEDYDGAKNTSVSLLPKVGYFIIDNLALGLDVNIRWSKAKQESYLDESTYTNLGVGPFIRYYIPTSKVLPFFEINSSFGGIKRKYKFTDMDESGESKMGVMSIGGGVGLAAPLGDRVTFDVLAGYNSVTLKDQEDNENNSRTVYGNLGLKIGFTLLLGSNE